MFDDDIDPGSKKSNHIIIPSYQLDTKSPRNSVVSNPTAFHKIAKGLEELRLVDILVQAIYIAAWVLLNVAIDSLVGYLQPSGTTYITLVVIQVLFAIGTVIFISQHIFKYLFIK